MKYSKDKKVVFNPENHTYFKGNKQLTSVTTLLGKFKNKFDSDHWSKVIAKRENTTQEVILAKWKEKAFKSTEIGTAIHKIFEDYANGNYSLLYGELDFDFMELKPKYFLDFNYKSIVAIDFIKKFFVTNRLIPIESEFIVYNDFIAGQVDMICKDHHGNYYILDFKTNEEIKKNSFGKNMIGCLDFLPDSSYYHYCIQLSVYKELLKPLNIEKLYLVHIKSDGYEFIECENVLNSIDLQTIINGC